MTRAAEISAGASPVRLDTYSELFVLTSHKNTKNLVILSFELFGPLDEEAMRQAVQATAESFPHLTSTVTEQRVGRKYGLFSQARPDLELPFFVSRLPEPGPDVHPFDAVMDHLRPRLDRQWDLFTEPPCEFHLFRLNPDHHVIVYVFHHIAADAGMGLEISAGVFGRYHRITTGEKPDWMDHGVSMSPHTKKKVKAHRKPGFVKGAARFLTETLSHRRRPAKPVGSGDPSDEREFQACRILSEADTGALLHVFRERGLPLVDRMVAASNISLDRWNEQRDAPSETITTAVTVSVKSRFEWSNSRNNSSVIFFRSEADDRKDPRGLALKLREARALQFERQTDLSMNRKMAGFISTLNNLPFSLRRRIAHHILEKHEYSFAVTFLGVVHPDTGDPVKQKTAWFKTGNLEILGGAGTNYKQAGAPYIMLISYLYRSQFNLVTVTPGSVLTKDECEEFTDLFLLNLKTAF